MDTSRMRVAEKDGAASRFALFSYGFRPFFLLAALYAALSVPMWLHVLEGGAWPEGFMAPLHWHAHEMIFGVVAAAIGGFILTAVPNWTGTRGYAGWRLMILVALWLTGRLALNPGAPLSPGWAAALDLLFFPALVITIAPSLIRSRAMRNALFPVLLALLYVANLLFHFERLGDDGNLIQTGLTLGVNTILMLVVLIGGRIVPSFTLSHLRRRGTPIEIAPRPLLDGAALASVMAVLVIDIFWPGGLAAGVLAVVAGALNAARLMRWQGWRTFSEPIVFVLHVGYAWVPVGLLLKGIHLIWEAPFASAWLHALTIGAFGTMILAVMTRAALGHTGRPIVASRATVVAYVMISLAALARVALPAFDPALYQAGLIAAGALWMGAFGLYLVVYAPVLVLRRADGRPG